MRKVETVSTTKGQRCDRASAKNDRGAVAIFSALAMTVLLGSAALAVDVGSWYTQRRAMQSAADAAAKSAALELARKNTESGAQAAALEDAGINGYSAATGAKLTVGFGTTAAGAKTVSVDISKPGGQFFSSMFLGDVTIATHSVASPTGAGGTACMVALNPNKEKALSIDSNTNITLKNCGIQVNSDHSQAMKADSNSKVSADFISTVGGYLIGSSASVTPTPMSGASAMADPLADLPQPSVGACSYNNKIVNSPGNTTVTLNPGVYCGGLAVKSNAVVTLNPGMYVIKNGKFLLDSNVKLTGTGVMFFLTGTNGVVAWDSNTITTLTAPTTGPYKGILFFQDRAFGGLHDFDSNNQNKTMVGTLYFPKATFNSDSNSTFNSSSCTMIIADNFVFSSNAGLVVDFDPTACPVPLPDGLTSQGVSLVES